MKDYANRGGQIMTLRSEFDTMQLTEKASFSKALVKYRVSNH